MDVMENLLIYSCSADDKLANNGRSIAVPEGMSAMTTILKVTRIIGADGAAVEDCSIVVNKQGNVVRYVPNSELNGLASDLHLEDRSAWTLTPLLADSHIHLGISDGITESADFHTAAIVR